MVPTASKERDFSIKLDEFPPKKPREIKPTKGQMNNAVKSAMKDFREIDLPKLERQYPPITGDTLKQVINE